MHVPTSKASYPEAVLYSDEPSLKEPLLLSSPEAKQPTEVVVRASQPLLLPLQLLAFVTGGLASALSQILLTQVLWNEDILEDTTSTMTVVFFSLQWSFWTCVITFSTLTAFMHAVMHYTNTNENDDDDMIFQIETHYVVGSLLTMTVVWLLDDIFSLPIHHPATVVAAALATYATFLVCLRRQQKNSNKNHPQGGTKSSSDDSSKRSMFPWLSTYSLVAGSLGFVVGVCSQFLLALFMWEDLDSAASDENNNDPSILFKSLVWSTLTVALAALACLSLRCFLPSFNNGNPGRNSSKNNNSIGRQEQLILLRMEAAYIGASLAGICVAWILIDVASDMPEQVLPNMLLLVVSLSAFAAILRCFPEDQCCMDDDCDQQQQLLSLSAAVKQTRGNISCPVIVQIV